jgi:hypothetical protein
MYKKTEILDWKTKRNIYNPVKQKYKTYSEVGEFADALIENDYVKIVDGIGDIYIANLIWADIRKVSFRPITKDLCHLMDHELVDQLFAAVLKNKNSVVLSILFEFCERFGYKLEYCVDFAFNEIKDRKGRSVEGAFVKE